MSKNYEIIHHIEKHMESKSSILTSAVVRMFNRLEERQCYASALSTSITLFLAMKHLGENPKLILGTIQHQGLSYPHAWIELDDKVFDIATYQDIKHHPVFKDRELSLILPQVNIGYESAANDNGMEYYPFQFCGTWELANMYKTVGKTFEEYAEASPYIDIWADLCYILEISETPDNLNLFKAMAKLETIKDKD